MNWTLWWLFVPIETALSATPGPAVLLVLATALGSGTRSSIASILGILSGNAVYFALSATGIGALLVNSHNLFFLVKWIGAAYLLFLAFKTWFEGVTPAPDAQPLAQRSLRRLYADAFLLQISNPKAIVFFAALLPQFVDSRLPVTRQVVILGLTSVTLEFFVLLAYAIAAGKASALAREPGYATWTNRAAALLLGFAALALAAW